MSEEYVWCERDEHVAFLTMCRPDALNTWSWEAAEELLGHVGALRSDREVRVVVLQAQGRAFCAGIDLTRLGKRVSGRSAAETVDAYHESFRELHERFAPSRDWPSRSSRPCRATASVRAWRSPPSPT